MEEAMIHRVALNEPEGAGVGVGENGLRSVCGASDVAEAGGDLVERVVPGDALEAAFTLPADAAQWMREATAVVRALDVAIHLCAEEAARERMIGIAGDADGATILDRDEHRARVGAIVRTGTAHDRLAGVQFDATGALGYGVVGGERCLHASGYGLMSESPTGLRTAASSWRRDKAHKALWRNRLRLYRGRLQSRACGEAM